MLITNATLVTWEKPNRILPGWAIYIKDGQIADLGPEPDLRSRYPQANLYDARGQLVLPGNICAHTHYYGAFARGMAIPGDAPTQFSEILQKLWWPLDRSLTEEDIRYSALLCLADAIRHGTTTLFDHHASPNAIVGSLDIIAEAVQQAGLRSCLCYEVTDRDGAERMKAGIQENVRFIERTRRENNPLLAAVFGLHASLTLSEKTLALCRQAAPDGTGFHIHLSESEDDGRAVQERAGMRPVAWLEKHGILGPNSIAAHCVYLDEEEREILANSQTWVTHQPRSNMNNAVGVAPVEDYLARGIRVGLGNDGFSNAMWEEWKAAYLLHKIHHRDPRRMSGYTVVEMAVYNNAAQATHFFGQTIGKLTVGAAADLIFVEYNPPTPLTEGNLPWHILFGFRETMLTNTMVNGKFLMKDREMLTLDEKEIAAKAHALAEQTWRRYEQKFKTL
ncbi:MAG: putative aminohydrolase SsnA [Anaerolineae bacterium]|nr:MAG: putative aminohydrolase SsnA [Anaerolineae bacterium]